MKKRSSNVILIAILLVGLSLLLYPSFSDWWNSYTSSRTISNYAEQVARMDKDKYRELWEAARQYNDSLFERGENFFLPEERRAEYESLLNVSNLGVMGYIEIPKLSVSLPIYHGTSDSVLQVAVGHLDWTSLPVGGESTHCVISGHRGLPSAKLFTDLDRMNVGDTFTLRILDEVLTYEVDRILIVLPEETEPLLIEEGKDYCTLVTCTPYAVNTHRLLVRGRRVENEEEARVVRVTADAMQIEPVIVAPLVAVPMLLVLLIILLLPKRRKENRGEAYEDKKENH